MDSRERIPIPTAQRWREFRILGVPVLVFSACILAVVHLWKNHVGSATMVGEAEAVRTQVASPQTGTLSELRVSRFQVVAEGDPVAVILPADSRVQLTLLEAELDVLQLRIAPDLSAQRNAMDYERLRLDWLQQKVDLATSRVALQRAENAHRKNTELFEMKILSPDLFDASEKDRDQIRAEVEERSTLISDIQSSIQRHESIRTADQDQHGSAELLAEGIRRIEARLRDAATLLEPIIITAPRAGMIVSVVRQPGEHVLDGDPILCIAAQKPERIVGYLRQPLSVEPEVGMKVLVTTRSARRLVGEAHVRHVGFQFEPVTNTLAIGNPGRVIDLGLPVEVSIPTSLALRPGEHVDLTIVTR